MNRKTIRVFVLTVLALSLLAPGATVVANDANDVGRTVTGDGPSLNGLDAPSERGTVPPCSPGVVAFSGSNSQMGRIFRDAIPSSCPSKAYPGIFNPGTPYFYETHTYSNSTAGAVCATVNFDPNPDLNLATDCDTNAHASAYVGSYDPNNQSANYVGDVGSSITDSFSFEIPAMSDLVLVVTNTAAEEVCNYTYEVVALDCVNPMADLAVQKSGALSGSQVTFTLDVTNNGPDAASSVVVTDTLPPEVSYVSNTCGASNLPPFTWNVGVLANGVMASCDILADVVGGPVITNTASVSSSATDTTPGNDSSVAAITVLSQIPTLGTMSLVLLIGLLAGYGLIVLRR